MSLLIGMLANFEFSSRSSLKLCLGSRSRTARGLPISRISKTSGITVIPYVKSVSEKFPVLQGD
jgi:hypothetical protein